MSYWDNNPKIFKLLITFVAMVFIAVIAMNFKENVYPTDENIYTNINDRIVTKKQLIIPVYDKSGIHTIDTIKPQTAFYKIDNREISTYTSMVDILNSIRKDTIELIVVPLHKTKYDTLYVNNSDLPDSTYFYYIEAGARIIQIIPGGASDRAGLKKGDIIISVNGKRFKNVFEADSMVIYNERGNFIEYTVLSEGRFRTTEVKLAKYGVKISYLSMIASGLLSLFFGWYISFFRPKLIGARITGFALMVAGMLFGAYLTIAVRFPEFQIFKSILVLVGSAFIVPLFIHSSYYFPKYNDVLHKRKWILLIPYLIAAIGIIPMNLFTFVFRSVINPSLLISIIFFLQVAYAITIHFTFLSKMDSEVKKMSKYIDLATFSLFIIGILNVLANINGWYKVNEYIFLGLFFFPLSYIFTIGRYRLFNIDLRIRRNIQYLFFSIIWKLLIGIGFVYIISYLINIQINLPNLHFTGTSVEVLDRPLREPLRDYYEKVIFLILSFIILFIVNRIGNAGLGYLDKIFNRTKLDFQKAYSKLMEMLENQLKINDISKKLAESIANIFQLKRAGFIVFKNSENVLAQNYYGLKEKSIREFIELIAPKLYSSASEYNGIFGTDYLPETIRDVFDDCKFSHIVSVKTQGRISGLLLIGEKLSESSFTAEDLEYINSIASQTAVSLENAFLYEDLAQQERMKHELEIARRIQLASLPQRTPKIDGLEISGVSIPALEVGGDFYDFLNRDADNLTIVVGDVSGKGTSAALYMSKVQGIMRTLYGFDLDPSDLFMRTNDLLFNSIEKASFISAIAIRIDQFSNSFKIARAGHQPLYYYSESEDKVTTIMPKGIALGITNNLIFNKTIVQTQYNYQENDIMLMLTDGILESRNSKGDEFGEYQLMQLIKKFKHLSAIEIRENIIKAVYEFSEEEEQFDDMTVVVVKAI